MNHKKVGGTLGSIVLMRSDLLAGNSCILVTSIAIILIEVSDKHMAPSSGNFYC